MLVRPQATVDCGEQHGQTPLADGNDAAAGCEELSEIGRQCPDSDALTYPPASASLVKAKRLDDRGLPQATSVPLTTLTTARSIPGAASNEMSSCGEGGLDRNALVSPRGPPGRTSLRVQSGIRLGCKAASAVTFRPIASRG